MKPTVLITGGNGFIGRKLTDTLLQAGFQVRITSRREPKAQPANPAVRVVRVDYNNVPSLQKAMDGCEGVFNLAAAIFGFSRADFERANVVAAQYVVPAANQTPGLKTFVHVSSLAASGYAADKNHPRSETDEP